MSIATQVSEQLREIVGGGLQQAEPYPVVAPASAEMLPHILRVARASNYRVMTLGFGSSFPSDLQLTRNNVVAITTSALNQSDRISPFLTRVAAGRTLGAIVRGISSEHKTLGGLIAGVVSAYSDTVLRTLYPRICSVRILTGNGEMKVLAGTSAVAYGDSGLWTCLIGSKGRAGLIVSVDILSPLPVDEDGQALGDYSPQNPDLRNTAGILRHSEVEALLDPEELFKW